MFFVQCESVIEDHEDVIINVFKQEREDAAAELCQRQTGENSDLDCDPGAIIYTKVHDVTINMCKYVSKSSSTVGILYFN